MREANTSVGEMEEGGGPWSFFFITVLLVGVSHSAVGCAYLFACMGKIQTYGRCKLKK